MKLVTIWHKVVVVMLVVGLICIAAAWQLNGWSAAMAFDGVSQQVPTDGSGSIQGRIMDDIGNPISGVSVVLILALPHSTVASVNSDSNGFYAFTNLAFDSYLICTFPTSDPATTEYFYECYDDKPYEQPPTPIVLSEATPIQPNIDVVLSSGAHISGQVTDESGHGLEGIEVKAYSSYNISPWQTSWLSYHSARSNINGEYTIKLLDARTYRICSQNGHDYVGECYNHVTNVETAQDIALTDMQRVGGYDFHLPLGGSITGVVTNRDGQSVPYMRINTYHLGVNSDGSSSWWLVGDPFIVQENGSYTVTGLATGIYRLQVQNPYPGMLPYMGEYYQHAYNVETATDIPVNIRETVSNINMRAGKSGVIHGHVSDTSGLPVDQIHVRAEAIQSDILESPHGDTDANGNYTITFSSGGIFRIRFDEVDSIYLPPGRGYASEYYNDSVTYEGATPILVEPDAVIEGIDAVLGHRGRISGTILDANGTSIPRIDVNLYSHDNNGAWFQFQKVTTDDSGWFEFPMLSSGNYRLCVLDNSLPIEFAPECYLDTSEISLAKDLLVTPDSTTSVTMALERLGIIEGTATSPYGIPLKNVLVSLWLRRTEFGVTPNGQARTDASGQFIFDHLLASTQDSQYYVQTDEVSMDGIDYNGEYYENKNSIESATPITVLLNQTTFVHLQLDFSPNVNAPPYARNDAIWVSQVATGTLFTSGIHSILANDQDFEHAPLIITLTISPTHGTLQLAASGAFTYTHDSSNTVFDSFTYHVNDGNSDSNSATVSIILPSAKNLFLPLIER